MQIQIDAPYVLDLLLRDFVARGGTENNALSAVALDGRTGRVGEGVRLHGETLRGQLAATNDLVNPYLLLGDELGLTQGIEVHGGTLRNLVEHFELDRVVDRPLVAGAQRTSAKLRRAAVKRVLSSLESWAGLSTSEGREGQRICEIGPGRAEGRWTQGDSRVGRHGTSGHACRSRM